jgi:hypothetical protein
LLNTSTVAVSAVGLFHPVTYFAGKAVSFGLSFR